MSVSKISRTGSAAAAAKGFTPIAKVTMRVALTATGRICTRMTVRPLQIVVVGAPSRDGGLRPGCVAAGHVTPRA